MRRKHCRGFSAEETAYLKDTKAPEQVPREFSMQYSHTHFRVLFGFYCVPISPAN